MFPDTCWCGRGEKRSEQTSQGSPNVFLRRKNGAGRRFAGGGDPGGFGADADALRQFDRMTRTSRGFSADSSFDRSFSFRDLVKQGRGASHFAIARSQI